MPKGVYDHKRKPWPARFWRHVFKTGPVPQHWPELGACWEWTGPADKHGYGRIWFNGKLEVTSRIAWLLAIGSLPTYDVLHKCDNPACVRFSHLYEGEAFANAADMVARDRQGGKLSNAQANTIREVYAMGQLNQYQLALKYNVTQAAIWYTIRRRKSK